jgi:serine protease Do
MEKSKHWRLNWVSGRAVIALGALALVVLPLSGQSLEGPYRLNGSQVQAAFEPVRQVLQTSSAVLYFERTPFGFGAVMSEDGYILTKASEVEGKKGISIRIEDKEYTDVTVVATDFEWDVALLKVAAEGLVPVRWSEKPEIAHGSWVVSNGATSRTRRRVRPGIISANARAIGGESQVVLGVVLKVEKEQIVIGEVADESGAKAAGLEAGDILLKAEGKEIKEREELVKMLEGKAPGDILKVTVLRGEEELELEIKLTARNKVFEAPMSRNDQMSGPVSQRRTNFARVIQHDTMLSERSEGGPLLDLDGRGVGLNIAYASRAEAFAIPADEVVKIYASLLAKGRE